MKFRFHNFRKVLFESLYSENKNHIIDKLVLPDLQDDPNDRLFSARKNYKNILKDFFDNYPNYENKIYWNKWKTLTKAEFDKVMELPKNSRKARKKQKRISKNNDPKPLFKNVNERKFKIVGETGNWLFVAPLNYEAAVYCNSMECGGGSAKWCIGLEKDNSSWTKYIKERSKFIMAFSKAFNTMPEKDLYTKLKYMMQATDDDEVVVWDQLDETIESTEALSDCIKFTNKSYIYGLFDSISYKEYELPKNPEVDIWELI